MSTGSCKAVHRRCTSDPYVSVCSVSGRDLLGPMGSSSVYLFIVYRSMLPSPSASLYLFFSTRES